VVDATLRRVVGAARSIVPGADLVSVTLRDPAGVFFTPVETSAVAGTLDRVQYRTGQGPCLDAARSDGPAYAASDDLATEVRWPHFVEAAAEHGVAAVLSTDLHTHGPVAVGGALNLYSTKARGLDDHDRHAALLLATHASLALAHTVATERAMLHNQNLHRASESRDVIGQAKGILMARQGMTADEAFEVLSHTSQNLNMKLVDLARTLARHPDSLDTPVRPRR
jgi:GAF domain-containing protein